MTTIEITKVTSAVTPNTTPKAKTYRKSGKTLKTAAKPTKTAAIKPATPKVRGVGPRFDNAAVAKRLETFKTITQLAKELKVTKPAAYNYVTKLGKARKLETKDVRQGKRGPQAIAFRVV